MATPDLIRQGNLAANLLREWLTAQLQDNAAVSTASVIASFKGHGVPWPTEFGAHNTPIENPSYPLHVEAEVTLPAPFDLVEELVDHLSALVEADHRLGSRFSTAHFDRRTVDTNRIDDQDQGPDAQRLTLRFTLKEPNRDAVLKS